MYIEVVIHTQNKDFKMKAIFMSVALLFLPSLALANSLTYDSKVEVIAATADAAEIELTGKTYIDDYALFYEQGYYNHTLGELVITYDGVKSTFPTEMIAYATAVLPVNIWDFGKSMNVEQSDSAISSIDEPMSNHNILYKFFKNPETGYYDLNSRFVIKMKPGEIFNRHLLDVKFNYFPFFGEVFVQDHFEPF